MEYTSEKIQLNIAMFYLFLNFTFLPKLSCIQDDDTSSFHGNFNIPKLLKKLLTKQIYIIAFEVTLKHEPVQEDELNG